MQTKRLINIAFMDIQLLNRDGSIFSSFPHYYVNCKYDFKSSVFLKKKYGSPVMVPLQIKSYVNKGSYLYTYVCVFIRIVNINFWNSKSMYTFLYMNASTMISYFGGDRITHAGNPTATHCNRSGAYGFSLYIHV